MPQSQRNLPGKSLQQIERDQKLQKPYMLSGQGRIERKGSILTWTEYDLHYIFHITVCSNRICYVLRIIKKVSTYCQDKKHYALLLLYEQILELIMICSAQKFWQCGCISIDQDKVRHIPIPHPLKHCEKYFLSNIIAHFTNPSEIMPALQSLQNVKAGMQYSRCCSRRRAAH